MNKSEIKRKEVKDGLANGTLYRASGRRETGCNLLKNNNPNVCFECPFSDCYCDKVYPQETAYNNRYIKTLLETGEKLRMVETHRMNIRRK